MQYALLIYNPDDDIAAQVQRPIDPGIEAAERGKRELLRVGELEILGGRKLLGGCRRRLECRRKGSDVVHC